VKPSPEPSPGPSSGPSPGPSPDERDLAALVVTLAVEVTPQAEAASFGGLARDGMFTRWVTSSEDPDHGASGREDVSGTALTTFWDEELITCSDLARDPAWPAAARRAAGAGATGSLLCVRVFVSHERLGVLTLHAGGPNAFSGADLDRARSLAALARAAWTQTEHARNLQVALDSRGLIGSAQGVLMERFDLGPDQAIGVLKRISNQSNRKLTDVAEELLRTRQLPGGNEVRDDLARSVPADP
jgi:hypothetical protein